jgi:hypothetical protein
MVAAAVIPAGDAATLFSRVSLSSWVTISDSCAARYVSIWEEKGEAVAEALTNAIARPHDFRMFFNVAPLWQQAI